jgi:hypothetical protein
MALQQVPETALAYSTEQRSEIQAAIASVGRLWRRVGADFDASYARVEPSLLRVLYACLCPGCFGRGWRGCWRSAL